MRQWKNVNPVDDKGYWDSVAHHDSGDLTNEGKQATKDWVREVKGEPELGPVVQALMGAVGLLVLTWPYLVILIWG